MADNAQVIGGFNPALSGAEQYGDALKPATTTNTKALAAGLRSMVKAMGGPIADRMAQHGAQQRQRLASGDYSPTPLTDESIDLADSVAGGLVGNLGMAAALRAYHGSPHRFDRFDMSKIGTGEGAQAFGHGLYFSEAPGVAGSYRDNLAYRDSLSNAAWNAPPVPSEDLASAKAAETVLRKFWGAWEPDDMVRQVRKNAAELKQAQDWLQQQRESLANISPEIADKWPDMVKRREAELASAQRGLDDAQAAVDALPALEKYGVEAFQRQPGALYTTRLDVEPEDLLDWDAPLSEQSEKVRAALANVELTRLKALYASNPEAAKLAPADNVLRERAKAAADKYQSGEEAIGALASALGGHDKVSAALRDAGVPGIRYLDQGSRASGEGTRNFVIFDDKLIDITHVDGMPVTKAERAEALAQHQDALPMDQASRMARARGMGFDVETPLFHGAADDFDAFDLQIDRTGAGYDAAWLTDDASLAYRYSRSAGAGPQDSVVMEVVAGLKNPKTIDVEDIIRKEAENMDFDLDQLGSMQEAQELFLPPNWKKDMAAAAKDEGHDGLVLKNFIDMPHGDYAPSSSTVVAVFDPAKIRKMSARFDPAKRDSADLLAGVAGAAGLGLAASLRAWAAQREDKGV